MVDIRFVDAHGSVLKEGKWPFKPEVGEYVYFDNGGYVVKKVAYWEYNNEVLVTVYLHRY